MKKIIVLLLLVVATLLMATDDYYTNNPRFWIVNPDGGNWLRWSESRRAFEVCDIDSMTVYGDVNIVGGDLTVTGDIIGDSWSMSIDSDDHAKFQNATQYDFDNDVNFSGNIASAKYGGMGFADSSYVLPVEQDTWTHVTNDENDLFSVTSATSGVTYTADSLYIQTAGVYRVSYALSFNGVDNEDWRIGLIVNDTDRYVCTQQSSGGTATIHQVANSTIISFSAGDGVELQIYNDTDADDPTIVCGTLIVDKIN